MDVVYGFWLSDGLRSKRECYHLGQSFSKMDVAALDELVSKLQKRACISHANAQSQVIQNITQ